MIAVAQTMGETVVSKRVMVQMRSPLSVRTSFFAGLWLNCSNGLRLVLRLAPVGSRSGGILKC
jgi:hypothetical protein